MKDVLLELLGWFAFLQRPAVLLQVGLFLALVAGLVQLRTLAPWPRLRWIRSLPLAVPLLAGLVVIALLLAVAGARYGLIFLAAQICLAWIGLRLLESQLLARCLSASAQQVLVSRLLRPIFLLLVLVALLDALGSLQDIASASLGVWFGSEITLGRLFTVLVVLYLLLVGLGFPSQWASLMVKQGLNLSEGSRRALEQILRYVLFSLGVIWAVASLGINQTGVLAVAGGLSVGLGFGIKEVFSNIISGLWLLIEGSVRPGEVLLHQGEVCEVRRLGPRATTLWRSGDNAELVVPNQDFFTTSTTTFTRSDRMRRCTLPLSLPRRWPPDQIISLLQTIATETPRVLHVPPPVARLQAFGTDLYLYNLMYSIADPLVAGGVASELRLAICRRFEALGIDPPS